MVNEDYYSDLIGFGVRFQFLCPDLLEIVPFHISPCKDAFEFYPFPPFQFPKHLGRRNLAKIPVGVSTSGVPGPTSKLSSRVPAQMGRRETEHEGGKERRETGERGNPRPSCCPAPRSGALAVGGYKRPRERERGTLRVVPSSRAANLLVREPWTFFYRRKEGVQVYNGGVAVC
jgi:hypothetical protein